MPPKKRAATSSVSAPDTPRNPGKASAQKATPKASLLAGTPGTKRKASEPVANTPASTQKKAKLSNVSKLKPEKQQDDVVDYEVECPAKAPKKNEAAGAVYRDKGGASLGLEVDFAVRPGDWGNMRSYKTVKYNDMAFRVGDFAYFAQSLEPPENISDEEVLASHDPLAFERENYWLGMIADARADNPQLVYLRILYAYWPEELPQGRQKYHGVKEVVMSNHMDIMDAHMIGGKVEVRRLDDAVEHVDGIYWRQTLDLTQLESKKKGGQQGVLSKLKGHCRCLEPTNLDKVVYICRHCRMWNHEECLVDDVLERAWEKHEAGMLGNGNGNGEDDDDTKIEEDESIEVAPADDEKRKSPVLTTLGRIASRFMPGSPAPMTYGRTETEIGDDTATIAASQLDGPAGLKAKLKPSSKQAPEANGIARRAGDPAPWDGNLSATIDATGKHGKSDLVMARVIDEKQAAAVWTTALSCFGCAKRLD